MGKKKATKVRKMWTGTKQVVVMGDEVPQDEMKANEVYSVLMLTKGDGRLNFEWGIVVTDNQGDVYKNWNVNAVGKWDSNDCAIKSTWRVFPASQKDREMATLYLTVITQHEQYKVLKYKHEHMSLWERIMGS